MFNTKVNGIPCQVKVNNSHTDFVLYDRKGYPAPWLERYVTENVSERIYKEAVSIEKHQLT